MRFALMSSPYLQLQPASPSPSSSSPPPTTTPTPPLPRTNNLTVLYYGLVVTGVAAIMIAVYNLIIMKWCGDSHRNQQPAEEVVGRRELTRRAGEEEEEEEEEGGSNWSQSFDNSSANLLIISSFKYKKKGGGINRVEEDQMNEYECAVCLSVFEEGEDVRQLPRCKHSFHKSCIDMWLHSHFDCPMCRSRVEPPPPPPAPALDRLSCPVRPAMDSRRGLLDPSIFAL